MGQCLYGSAKPKGSDYGRFWEGGIDHANCQGFGGRGRAKKKAARGGLIFTYFIYSIK